MVGQNVRSTKLDLENVGFSKCLHCRTYNALFSFCCSGRGIEMFAKLICPWKSFVEGNLTRLMLLGQKVKTCP